MALPLPFGLYGNWILIPTERQSLAQRIAGE